MDVQSELFRFRSRLTFAAIAGCVLLLSGPVQAADTDNDGLTDDDENNIHFTDPFDSDTDGDGIGDGGEVNVGMDPLDSSDGPVFDLLISDGINGAFAPSVGIDSAGNTHVVWSEEENEIFYKMLDSGLNTLIDQTPLTGGLGGARTRVAVGSDDRVYVLSQDGSTVKLFRLDPSLDDQDGDAADPLVLVELTAGVADGNVLFTPAHPAVVLDSADNLHIVFTEAGGGLLVYTKLDLDGNVLISETQIGVSGANHPTASIGLDSNENVHFAWSDPSLTFDDEIYYAMLNGGDGSTMIAATLVTADDFDWEKHTSLIVDNDLVTIVWAALSASTSAEEIYLMQLNPGLDDQDGSAADPMVIKTVAETRLTADNGATNWYVTATQGADGNLDITSGAGALVGDVPISYLKADLVGNVLVPERALTTNVHDFYSFNSRYYAPVIGNGAYLRENVGGVDSIVRWRVGANNTVMTATATGIATATVNSGLLFVYEALALTDLPAAAQASVPTDAVFDDGFFGIVIDNVPVGGHVHVTLDLPGTYVAGMDPYYKWDAVNGWYTVPFTNGVSANQVILTLTDGGAGDADGVANGQIVDPGGPGSTVPVPDVVGLTQANAEAAIVGAGLVVGAVTTANSNAIPIGDVISQNPGAGTDVVLGSTVDIEVSLGASVSDVVGLREADAGAAIVGAGLVVGNVTTANNNTVSIGDVISQNPGAGIDVAPGSTVDIEVSLGPATTTVSVPDVVGLTQANAEAAIVGAGLVVGAVTTANSNTVPVGDVISQNPVVGTGVAPGSTVNIEVSLGPAGGNNFLSGGGCSLVSADSPLDPTLPILLLIALMYLTPRGWMRIRLF